MNTAPQTFIFIGRSGSGKGTQALRLIEYLKRESADQAVLYLETGNKFRSFIANDASWSARLAGEIINAGNRVPSFFAVWNWSDYFINNLKGDEHLIVDGSPRFLSEAESLDQAMTFYQRSKPVVIYLLVANHVATGRLQARGRGDDQKAGAIDSRLSWFDREVLPAVEFYRGQPDKYQLLEINGEQEIAEVTREILEQL